MKTYPIMVYIQYPADVQLTGACVAIQENDGTLKCVSVKPSNYKNNSTYNNNNNNKTSTKKSNMVDMVTYFSRMCGISYSYYSIDRILIEK